MRWFLLPCLGLAAAAYGVARAAADDAAADGASDDAPASHPALRTSRAPTPADWLDAGRAAVRGATIGPVESALEPDHGYGTPLAGVALDEVARLGANWVSLTPFGRLWSVDDTHVRMDFEAPWSANRDAVRRTIRDAHARGLRVLLIPHLWVDTGGWRGDVDPGTPERWAAYHDAYREFVLRWARDAAAAGADAFSIGVECKSWSNRFPEVWSALIGDVRAVFPGHLTYSANWDEAEQVVFWEELDLIGINAFYPLADAGGASYATYVAGARRWADRVGALAASRERPVLFVEIGYTTRPDAAVEPWLWPDGMRDVVVDEREQARAVAALLEGFVGEPWFVGFFVWRWYANPDDVSQEAAWGFSPHGKEAERLLHRIWSLPFAADPGPLAPVRRSEPTYRWPLVPRLLGR